MFIDKNILHKEYSREKITRENAQMFEHLVKGDVRCANGLYRTEDEFSEEVEKVMKMKIPGI